MFRAFLITSLLFSISVSAQEITQNEKDEFTGAQMLATSFENLNMGTLKRPGNTSYRFRKMDSTYVLDMRIQIGSVVSVRQGGEIMFKTSDGIIKGSAIEFTLSCSGCGVARRGLWAGQGIDINYLFSREDIERLAKYRAEKMRLYFSDGYLEWEIKDRKAELFQESARLILNPDTKPDKKEEDDDF